MLFTGKPEVRISKYLKNKLILKIVLAQLCTLEATEVLWQDTIMLISSIQILHVQTNVLL